MKPILMIRKKRVRFKVYYEMSIEDRFENFGESRS